MKIPEKKKQLSNFWSQTYHGHYIEKTSAITNYFFNSVNFRNINLKCMALVAESDPQHIF